MDKSVTLKEMDKATFILKMGTSMSGNFMKAKSWDMDNSIRMEFAHTKDFGLMANSLVINNKLI